MSNFTTKIEPFLTEPYRKTRVSVSYFTLVAGFIISGGKIHFYDEDSAHCILHIHCNSDLTYLLKLSYSGVPFHPDVVKKQLENIAETLY